MDVIVSYFGRGEQNFLLNLILRVIIDPDGSQTIFPALYWMLISAQWAEISIQQGCRSVL